MYYVSLVMYKNKQKCLKSQRLKLKCVYGAINDFPPKADGKSKSDQL